MRILNVTLNEEKKIVLALTDIYGIGLKRSKKILTFLNVSLTTTIKNLEEDKKEKLRLFLLNKEKKLSTYLKRSINNNIKKNIMMNTFKGTRYKNKMPVRGQRSRSNNRTNKKKVNNYFDL